MDQATGAGAAAAGSAGLSVQWATDFSNLFLVGLNLVLATLGILLIVRRLKLTRLEREEIEHRRRVRAGEED